MMEPDTWKKLFSQKKEDIFEKFPLAQVVTSEQNKRKSMLGERFWTYMGYF